MRVIAAGLLVVAMAAPVQAGQTPPSGQAYYEFMMARRLEALNDLTGAQAALRRALDLDPESAELHAELAGFYARQDKADEAMAAAQQALGLDKDNVEAHRIMGLVDAALADSQGPPPAGETPATLRASAIDHLSRVMLDPSAGTDLNLQLTLARLYLRNSQADKALPLLESISSQAPFAAEPLTMKADAHLALGQMDEAVEALEAAAEINPRYFAALGDLHERQNRWADAAGAYGKAAEGAPGPAARELRLRWASALLNVEGGAAKAADIVGELLKANPKDARALYLLSSAQRASGDLASAEATARQLIAMEPASVPGLSALAQVLSERHDYKAIVDVLTPFATDASRGKGREGESALLLARLGFAQRQLGNDAQAIEAFEGAQRLAPRNPLFDLYLLQTYISGKKFDRATALASDALGRHPGDQRLLRLQAQALAGAGKSADAVKLLQNALAADPDSRDLAVGLASMHAERREYDAAIGVLQKAKAGADEGAEDESLTLQLASVFEEADRPADAEREFRRLLQRDPLNANALNGLGYMLADRGQRLPEAIALIQRALTVDPDNPAYLDSLGWALFKQGKTAEAEPHLRRAAESSVGSSAIQEHFGDLLARQRRYRDAMAAWQRALDGDGTAIDRPAVQRKIKDAQGKK